MPHQNLSANERTTVVTVSRRSLPRPRKKRKPNKTEVVKNLIKHLTKTAMEICIKGTFKKSEQITFSARYNVSLMSIPEVWWWWWFLHWMASNFRHFRALQYSFISTLCLNNASNQRKQPDFPVAINAADCWSDSSSEPLKEHLNMNILIATASLIVDFCSELHQNQ